MTVLSHRARIKAGNRRLQERVAEVFKCRDDPFYFISNYIQIAVNGVLTQLKPYDLQEQLIDDFQNHTALIVKHPRQAGISTITMAYLVWETLFKSSEAYIVLLPNTVMARHAYELYRSMLGTVPHWMTSQVASSVNMSVLLMNGSVVYFAAANANLHYTMTPATIYLSDFAFFDNNAANVIWLQQQTAISRGARIIISSTPYTATDVFATLWAKTHFGVPPLKTRSIGFWDLPTASQKMWNDSVARIGLNHTKRELGAEIPG